MKPLVIEDLIPAGSVIPVVVIDDASKAVPLAKALLDGGITAIEITLRTPAALDAARAIADDVPQIALGIGTVTEAAHVQQAIDVGARFLVSPGLTPQLAQAANVSGLPYLPGVSTVSEIMQARELGFKLVKFFPAEQAGGVKMLKYFASLFEDQKFCPTGGISADNYRDYLALDNVDYVGGSWLAPGAMLGNSDWAGITKIAAYVVRN